ncbi:hypothetical protein SeLEV6574_g05098 [Synchytrium endobioticum]|uniref:Uncharacterized protein n=1 Tax=Synchytrium endobioticum TaxID=286115 RepID=A0A507CW45_9FUNG|nr:hypothetical protein SeLEV6574_g05098 [Synchytrium endobioticum]
MASIPELILRSPSNTAATSGYNLQQLPTVRLQVIEELACMCRVIHAVVLLHASQSRQFQVIPTTVSEIMVLITDGIQAWHNNNNPSMSIDVVSALAHPDLLDLVLALLVNSIPPTRSQIEVVLNLGICDALSRLLALSSRVGDYHRLVDKILKLLGCVLGIQMGRKMFRVLPVDVAYPVCHEVMVYLRFWNRPKEEDLHLRALRVAVELRRCKHRVTIGTAMRKSNARKNRDRMLLTQSLAPKRLEELRNSDVSVISPFALRHIVEVDEIAIWCEKSSGLKPEHQKNADAALEGLVYSIWAAPLLEEARQLCDQYVDARYRLYDESLRDYRIGMPFGDRLRLKKEMKALYVEWRDKTMRFTLVSVL